MSVIFGRVTDKNNTPIVNVQMAIIDGTGSYPEIIALTDNQGEYDIDYVEAGTFTVAAEKEGYKIQRKTIKVGKNKEVKLDFILSFQN